MTSTVRWQIYCTTEAKWSSGLRDQSLGAPTTCFNVSTHSVDLTSAQQIGDVQLINVKVIQEDVPTGGHYCTEGFVMNLAALETQTLSIKWPMNTTATVVHVQSLKENLDDTLSATINPYTLIGTITSNVAINTTTANVSSTVITNIKIGFDIYINTENLGRVISIDTTNLIVTFENPTTIAHIAGEYVYTEMKLIKNFQLGTENGNDLGLASIGGKYLKANTVTNIIYKNNTNIAKRFRFSIEYLF